MSLNIPTLKTQPKEYDHLIKVLLIGDSGVGKSSFVLRVADDTYTENYISTIGVDFKIKYINLNEKEIKVQLWDVFINSRFNIRAPYRQSQCILILYDLTDRVSFENSKKWFQEVERYGKQDAILTLVGTKLDLVELNPDIRAIPYEEAEEFANLVSMDYIECSSKYNINLDQCINDICLRNLKSISEESAPSASSIILKKKQSKNDKCNIN